MKLNWMQAAWLLAAAALIASMLADVAGMVQIPPIYWLAGCGLLVLIGRRVMPSLAKLKTMERRPRR